LPLTAVVSGMVYYLIFNNGADPVNSDVEKDLPLPPSPE
jgi:hypothetical protein